MAQKSLPRLLSLYFRCVAWMTRRVLERRISNEKFE
jgi:hypothetical protein